MKLFDDDISEHLLCKYAEFRLVKFCKYSRTKE